MFNVIIRGLPSLDNYGTAMMALVTMQALADRLQGPIQLHCNLDPGIDIEEIYGELDVDRGRVTIVPFVQKPRPRLGSIGGIAYRIRMLRGSRETADGDLLIVLGGDDLSEYYGDRIWRQMLYLWLLNHVTPVLLLGQTIGPFVAPMNRLAVRLLMRKIRVVTRDRWTTAYLRSEFGLGDSVRQGTDLAWADLPLQRRKDVEDDVLGRFGLTPDGYATVIISGMQQRGYYTTDRSLYIRRWVEVIEGLLSVPGMANYRICLLAHTFGRYGDEGRNVTEVAAMLSPSTRARVVAIPDRVLPNRARSILGNGLFTITGRMHPAVSTFQMGKPAITLSYSKKYEGVIGTMIGRSDLILNGDVPELWSSGEIVSQILELAKDLMARHSTLCEEIRMAVAEQKQIVNIMLDEAAMLLQSSATPTDGPFMLPASTIVP